MTMTRQNNEVTDHTSAVYVEKEIEHPLPIRWGTIQDEA